MTLAVIIAGGTYRAFFTNSLLVSAIFSLPFIILKWSNLPWFKQLSTKPVEAYPLNIFVMRFTSFSYILPKKQSKSMNKRNIFIGLAFPFTLTNDPT
jgi:hypothetical protein